MDYVLYALTAIVVIFLVKNNMSLRKKMKETNPAPVEKAKRTLSDFKARMSMERMVESGTFDGVIATVEEFEEMVELDRDEFAFFERQARFFLECAVNLMAHSYADLEEAKKDASGIFELAFDEDIVTKYKKKDPGAGGVHETI
ncbi:hypothetical protein EVB55_028 [Rhizobium phage RHph_Y68]|uniref:Uncharacterized protein n=1 Tax=Rhizobium phage RHph_Y68 TaxID=2509787 RepID=A0A7S5QXR5_9CAUD|nr:hypothetical protein PP934_gp028 [Rhizobium phage RHph_Y68]QIG67963.1 hypothetical protein EVB55_028 [Rhizobium phage RHph_Y68]